MEKAAAMTNRKKASLRRMTNRGKTCQYPGCKHNARAKGYCSQHYFTELQRKKHESAMSDL